MGHAWKLAIRAGLEENGALTDEHLKGRIRLDSEPGEFWLFNSWLLHGSAPNQTDDKRTAINMRFARRGEEYEPQFEYIPVGGCAEDPVDDACGVNAMRDYQRDSGSR